MRSGDPHVALLFPPATDPRNPHLAMPSLAAALRGAGVRVTMRDLDLEGLLWLLEPTRLERGVRACADAVAAGALDRWPDAWRIRNLLADPERLVSEAVKAPSVLRDEVAFFDPHAYRVAREAIAGALDVVSCGLGGVRYNIAPVRYDVRGADPARLGDLLRVTQDADADVFAEFWAERVLGELDADRPDVVGLSILNHQQVIPGLRLARLLRRSGHTVLLGGTVYAKFVDSLLKAPEFFAAFCDGLVAYEGETAILALVDELGAAGDLSRVPNLISLDRAGRPRMGPHHLEDVNALPTPDFDGLPLSDYLAPAPVFPLLMGKGCYFNKCKFCDIPYINRTSVKSYRIRSADRVAADVAQLNRRHGVRHFEFTDEALAPRLLLKLGDALEDHPGVHARFTGFARFEPAFTPDVCRRLHDRGVRKLFFGLESGSQETLDHMHKGIRVDVAERVLANCREAGISFHIFSMIGFPEERPESARETVNFFVRNREIIEQPQNSFDIHRFTLDLRTEYGEHPERFGIRVNRAREQEREFPVSAARWECDRGMDGVTIAALLEDFAQTLRRTYRRFHAYPLHLWPDWATYSVLYADHYAERAFGHRVALPADGDPTRFRLRWHDGVRVRPEPGGQRVSCLTGEGVVSEVALRALLDAPRGYLTAAELLEVLGRELGPGPAASDKTRAGLRGLIDSLLMIGALACQAEPDGAPGAGSGVALSAA
jgi:anaerobic magnesium-protoporphyrin IX monomethyl ester cyclase